jgi:hypothetical protein
VQSTPRGAELTPEVLAALRQGPMTRTPLLKFMEQYSIQLGYQRLASEALRRLWPHWSPINGIARSNHRIEQMLGDIVSRLPWARSNFT